VSGVAARASLDGDPASATRPALEFEAVGFRLSPAFALEEISFAVRSGEFTALLGLNGAGKTTLFSLVTRLYESPRGKIRIFGRDLRAEPSACLARIGVVFQQPTLDLDLTVERNLLYHGALHGLSPREIVSRIEELLRAFGLDGRRGDKVRRLNSGHRRRIEIARALLHRPELLLLDEPTVGLDIPTRQQLVEDVHELCRADGLAVLWATHLVDEVAETDSIVLLHEGRILLRGGPQALRHAAEKATLAEAFTALVSGAGRRRP
jgi:ABC-2 type transport system ATP-binding protein